MALASVPAGAAETVADDVPETTQIIVTQDDCRALTRYVADGSADYKPGVDAYGRPVAGANLDGGSANLVADEITFTLTVRLADFVPNLAKGLGDSSAPLGEITVRGRDVLFNGQPLTDAQSNAVYVACRDELRAKSP